MNSGKGIDQEAAMTMLAAGRTLTEVGKAFGVSRQRIQQIAQKHDVESRCHHGALARRRNEIQRAILNGESDEEIAARFGVAVSQPLTMRRSLGLGALDQRERKRAPILKNVVKAVNGGMSVLEAARVFGFSQTTLVYHLEKRGIKSKAPSRWKDLSYRYALIPEMKAEGRSWAEIADKLSEIDGYKLRKESAYLWCRKHLPHLVGNRTSAE